MDDDTGINNEREGISIRRFFLEPKYLAVLVFVVIVFGATAFYVRAFAHGRDMDNILAEQIERDNRIAQQQRMMDTMQSELEAMLTEMESLSLGHEATISNLIAEMDSLQYTIDELVAGLPEAITTDTVLSTVRQVAELTTLVHEYTDITIQDENNFFTRRLLIIRYSGRVRVGVDFDRIGIDVQNGTITVSLPNARIFSHELPFESIEVVRDETGLFTPSNTIPDFVDLMADLQRAKEAELIQQGILADARANAQQTVTQLINAVIISHLGNPADYTIVFR